MQRCAGLSGRVSRPPPPIVGHRRAARARPMRSRSARASWSVPGHTVSRTATSRSSASRSCARTSSPMSVARVQAPGARERRDEQRTGWWRWRDQQHLAARARPAARPARRRVSAPRRVDREVEHAALAGHTRALDPHRAAHQLGEPLGDRQAQAGAAVAARRRDVGLARTPEQAVAPAPAGCRCRCRAPDSGRRSPSSAADAETTSPGSVNLIALLSRLSRICRRR